MLVDTVVLVDDLDILRRVLEVANTIYIGVMFKVHSEQQVRTIKNLLPDTVMLD